MEKSLPIKSSVPDSKDIIISNFRDTINNLTNIVITNANKMKDLNDLNHKNIYTKKDIDIIKQEYIDKINNIQDNLTKINRSYGILNNVYTKHIKTSIDIESALKSKIINLENDLDNIRDIYNTRISDIHLEYNKKIENNINQINELRNKIKTINLDNSINSLDDISLNDIILSDNSNSADNSNSEDNSNSSANSNSQNEHPDLNFTYTQDSNEISDIIYNIDDLDDTLID